MIERTSLGEGSMKVMLELNTRETSKILVNTPSPLESIYALQISLIETESVGDPMLLKFRDRGYRNDNIDTCNKYGA